MPEDRRHAAIMFTDIAGYTSLMGSDEDEAFDMLKNNHMIHEKFIKQFRGNLIKEIGDGTLSNFSLASEAVRCAIEIQKACKEQNIPLKIGINEGEMIFAGSDVFGDSVNIASRLQESCAQGEIIISDTVFREVKNKSNIITEFAGQKVLKNVNSSVDTYKVLWDKCVKEEESAIISESRTSSLISAKHEKSIAVLPFENMSGDTGEEYMCDGLTEEIIYTLGQISDFENIISRNSVMGFKNTNMTIPEIAEKLSVGTILTGSYRKSGNRIRILVNLINTENDKTIWQDVYDRDFDDILLIQSDIALKIASSLRTRLSGSKSIRLNKKITQNLEAYDLIKKASFLFNSFKIKEAVSLTERAIQLDGNYSEAYALYSAYLIFSSNYTGQLNIENTVKRARAAALKAISLDPELSTPHWVLGGIYFWYEWDFIKAEEEFKKSIQLNHNDLWNHGFYGNMLMGLGRFNESLNEIIRSYEISPAYWMPSSWLANFYYYIKDYEGSINMCKQGTLLSPDAFEASAFTLLHMDSLDLAHKYLESHDEYLRKNKVPEFPRWYLDMSILYTKKGDVVKAATFIKKLMNMLNNPTAGSPDYFLALYYGFLENKEETLKFLQSAFNNRSPEMTWLKIEPSFQFLKNDPRYLDLNQKVGFSKYDEYIMYQGLD